MKTQHSMPDMRDMLDKRSWKLPKTEKALEAVSTFSPIEKGLFFTFVGLLVVSTFTLLWKVNNAFLVTVPDRGGTLTEGVVGSPRFINPLLAVSDADKDLVALVYSGLMKATPENRLVPDLARDFTVSEDGRTYTFVIREDAYFHDGRPVTSADVEFTVRKAQDPSLKSPRRVNWEGVEIEAPDAKTVRFILKQPYAPFLDNMTIGILPKHMWGGISSDQFPFSYFNLEPVGSGPYEVKTLKRDSEGLPVYYQLKPFDRHALGEAYVSNLIIRFFGNENELVEAYRDGRIEAMRNLSPTAAAEFRGKARIETAAMPRVFGIFFNQSEKPIFTDKAVRAALDRALDKEGIVADVLGGFGVAIDGPVPPGTIAGIAPRTASGTPEERIAEARAMLEKAGWKPGEDGVYEKAAKDGDPARLAFSISTSDTPELKRAADLAAAAWRKAGAAVEVHVFELGDLNQNVIRSRKYDALLFGQIIGRDLDFYPFWHSSQRNDPGLNIAGYASVKTDKMLEEAREAVDEAARLEKYREFDREIRAEVPAAFLYSPQFIYVLPRKLQGAEFGQIVAPADRYYGISSWYIETNQVWRAFTE